MKFSKRIIITIFVFVALFVVAMTVTYWIMRDVPESLITAVSAMVTAEGGFLMLIKNVDTKHGKKDESETEESEENENDEY